MTAMKRLMLLLPLLLLIELPSQGFAARATFIPRVGVNSYYTDNIDLDPVNEESDIVTTVSAGFNTGLESQTAGVTLDFLPGYAFYKNRTEDNNWRLNANLNAFADVSQRTQLSLSNGFFLTEDPEPEELITLTRQGEEDVEIDPTLRRGRNQYYRNNLNAQITHQFGRDDSMYVAYTYSILRNDGDFNTDSDNNTGRAGITYYFGPKWGVDLSGRFTRGTFEPSGGVGFEVQSDFDAWAGDARLIRRFNRNTSGYLQYGYTGFYFVDELEEDYNVHDARIGFEHSIEEDITLSMNIGGYLRQNEFTEDTSDYVLDFLFRKQLRRGGFRIQIDGGYDNLFFTSQSLGFTKYARALFTADYELFKRFYGDIYGAYRIDDYEDTTPDREDDIYTTGAGFSWQALRWARIRLGYSFRRRDSNVEINDYTENRVLLTIGMSPELPYRALY